MRIQVLVLSALLTLSVLMATSCSNTTGDWAAKIDGKTISIEEFNRYYYTQNKMMANVNSWEDVDSLANDPSYANHPFLNKSNFLDHLIAQKLIYNKAMNDKTIDKEELDTILDITKIQTAAQYFLSQKLKDKIQVTDEEVERFYNQNRRQFAGRTSNEATAYIRQQILAHKSRQEANKYVMELVAESEVKKDGLREYLAKQKKTDTPAEEKK